MNQVNKVESMKDFFDACCFLEEDKKYPETVVGIATGAFEEGKEMAPEVKTMFRNVNFRFRKHSDFFEADILFRGKLDPNLKRTLDLLADYGEKTEQYYWTEEEENVSFPSLQFLIVPMILRGRYQVILADPEFSVLCSDSPNEYPSIVKLLFTEDNVVLMEYDSFDYNKMAAEVKRQEDMQAFLEMEEEKKQKRDVYEAEFNFNKAGGN